jgi:hypothetical protein
MTRVGGALSCVLGGLGCSVGGGHLSAQLAALRSLFAGCGATASCSMKPVPARPRFMSWWRWCSQGNGQPLAPRVFPDREFPGLARHLRARGLGPNGS